MKSDSLCLGIETSCDETSIALVDQRGLVVAMTTHSQAKDFADLGGVIPEMASRMHCENIIGCLEATLVKIDHRWDLIQRIAVTKEPGLLGSLLVGCNAAHALGFVHKLPVKEINHLYAHVLACQLINSSKQTPVSIKYPALALLVSGGHTELLLLQNPLGWKIVGQTLDDAAGEAFDKVASLIGLPYPGGPQIEKKALSGDASKFNLPQPLSQSGNIDFSFSGLKSAVLREVTSIASQKLTTEDKEQWKADLCAAFVQTVVQNLLSKTKQAQVSFGAKSVIVAGGVAASPPLRKAFQKTFGDNVLFPDRRYCVDNGAMIAWAGWQSHRPDMFNNS